jgi:hypothetical protein
VIEPFGDGPFRQIQRFPVGGKGKRVAAVNMEC